MKISLKATHLFDPVSPGYDKNAETGRDDVSHRDCTGGGVGEDEEAKDNSDSFGNVKEGVLDGTEHAEDDSEADDVIDGMEESSSCQEEVGRPRQVMKTDNNFKTLGCQAT